MLIVAIFLANFISVVYSLNSYPLTFQIELNATYKHVGVILRGRVLNIVNRVDIIGALSYEFKDLNGT